MEALFGDGGRCFGGGKVAQGGDLLVGQAVQYGQKMMRCDAKSGQGASATKKLPMAPKKSVEGSASQRGGESDAPERKKL